MNEEYSFTATMQDVGNEYQNTSTMFDMQLSFTEVTQMDTPTTTSNSNSSSSSSGGGGSTSFTSSSTSNIPATLGTSTQQFFSQLIDTVFAEEVEEATTEVSDEENSNDTSEVLGEQQSVCQNKEWWWIVAIGFVLSELVLLALKEHFKPLMKIIMYLGTGAIGGILLYIALCNPFWWIIGISAGSLLSYGFARSQ